MVVGRIRPFLLVATMLLTFIVLAGTAAALPSTDGGSAQLRRTPSYTEFLNTVRQGQVTSVSIKGHLIQGQYEDDSGFALTGPTTDPNLLSLLDQYGVQTSFGSAPSSAWYTLVPIGLVLLFVLGLFLADARTRAQKAGGAARDGRQARGPGKSGAKVLEPGLVKVRFADVAGQEEVKADLQEIVDFLRFPDKYTAMGAHIPKGVLLYGPPGTGKTLLARAVAGEAGVSFIQFSASQFVEVFVGVGASRVRDLFATARGHAPCIIFVDELDAVGRHRGSGMGGSDEREQTLNQLLVEMDGFANSDGIIVMAATNRSDVLDKALLRPGRFDRQIPVDVPDLVGRRAILEVHARGKVFQDGVNLEAVARQTPGLTGADLANVLNEAALLTVRSRADAISMNQINEAIDRVVAGGPAKHGRLITPAEKFRVAVHEAGHVLAARLQPNPNPVYRVTIIPRGRAGGFTMTMPEQEHMLYTRTELMERLVMLMAGRAAEALVLGEASTGAQNDLERAYAMARQMVAHFGMSGAIGPVGLPLDNGGFDKGYSEDLAALVDREVRAILKDVSLRSRILLTDHRMQLERVAAALLERETLEGPELDRLLGMSAPVEAV